MKLNSYHPKEWKLKPMRDLPCPVEPIEQPAQAAHYWRKNIEAGPTFNMRVECFCVIMVNTRRRAVGHFMVATGTLDTLLVHPREVFAPACIANAAAIILMHNHPSGDPSPSEGDIKVTRDLIRAGQLLKIDVLDHVVMGQASAERTHDHVSLRESGYFYT